MMTCVSGGSRLAEVGYKNWGSDGLVCGQSKAERMRGKKERSQVETINNCLLNRRLTARVQHVVSERFAEAAGELDNRLLGEAGKQCTCDRGGRGKSESARSPPSFAGLDDSTAEVEVSRQFPGSLEWMWYGEK